jgi:exopolyphosphatase/guanosine-5'-triphosphate,3'-diphosphate pyrophosphatase
MSELIALLDLGSNAARFLLARIHPGIGYRVLRRERVQTRLGAGSRGQLPPKAIDLTLASASRFLASLGNGNGHPRPRVMAVATAAVRDASNRDRLIEPLRVHEGVDVRILSGREEAHLGALAALRSLPLRDGVIADLGGGSLQLARVRAGVVEAVASLPLGAVRMTRRFLRHDPPTLRELRAVRQEVRKRVLGVLPPARRIDELIGLGGTVRALARLHLEADPSVRGRRRKRHGLRLYQSDVTAVRERLQAAPLRRRRRIQGLKAERADIILAGAIAIEELMVFGGYPVLTVCKTGVRDGLLLRETFNGGDAP